MKINVKFIFLADKMHRGVERRSNGSRSCPVSTIVLDREIIVAGSSAFVGIHISSGFWSAIIIAVITGRTVERTGHTTIITSSVDESLTVIITRGIVDTVESAINFVSCFDDRRRREIIVAGSSALAELGRQFA